MDNLKKKNKSISRFNKKNTHNLPKSVNNHNCLAPCYPPNTLYYHPIYFLPILYDNYSCPTEKFYNKSEKKTFIDFCKKEDSNDDYKKFDIFEDMIQIANTPLSFLEQIYNINIIQDATQFLNDTIDELPYYSQKRLLNAIYSSFGNNITFPKELFSEKVHNVLKNIYNINLPVDKISKKLFSDKNIDDIFLYFSTKYSN